MTIHIQLDLKDSGLAEQQQILGKKVKIPNSFRQLKSQAGSFATKNGVKNEINAVLYEEDGCFISVEDDDDFELCLEKAIKTTAKAVTFLIQFASKEKAGGSK